jgi:hypothetical protein
MGNPVRIDEKAFNEGVVSALTLRPLRMAIREAWSHGVDKSEAMANRRRGKSGVLIVKDPKSSHRKEPAE